MADENEITTDPDQRGWHKSLVELLSILGGCQEPSCDDTGYDQGDWHSDLHQGRHSLRLTFHPSDQAQRLRPGTVAPHKRERFALEWETPALLQFPSFWAEKLWGKTGSSRFYENIKLWCTTQKLNILNSTIDTMNPFWTLLDGTGEMAGSGSWFWPQWLLSRWLELF